LPPPWPPCNAPQAPWQEAQWARVAPRVAQRLGVSEPLRPRHVDALWQLCTFHGGLLGEVAGECAQHVFKLRMDETHVYHTYVVCCCDAWQVFILGSRRSSPHATAVCWEPHACAAHPCGRCRRCCSRPPRRRDADTAASGHVVRLLRLLYSRAQSGGACSAFDAEDAAVMERAEDVRLWHEHSYGHTLNSRIAAPLMADLARSLVVRMHPISTNRLGWLLVCLGEGCLGSISRGWWLAVSRKLGGGG
jgi:hypothetical protein